MALFSIVHGILAQWRIDDQRFKLPPGPVVHEGHDRLQPFFEARADGLIHGQTPLSEIKGRNDASHDEGMRVWNDRFGKSCFGFNENFLRRPVAIFEGHRGRGPNQAVIFLLMQVAQFHFTCRRLLLLDGSNQLQNQ